MEFDGKVALVTGAGSGIGQATAMLLAHHGAFVGCLTHNEAEARAVAEDIRQAGGQAEPLLADVGDAAAMRQEIDALAQRRGRLDLVMANAGINGVQAPIDELEPDEWDRTINANLRGTYLTFRYAVPHLKASGGGSIVVTSSINGTRVFSNSGATAYATTKAGQLAMAKMLALELAKHLIRVNIICPGRIATEIGENTEKRHVELARTPVEYPEGEIPLTGDQPGTAGEVAELAFFLLSDRAKHITGTPVWIDGGQSLLMG